MASFSLSLSNIYRKVLSSSSLNPELPLYSAIICQGQTKNFKK